MCRLNNCSTQQNINQNIHQGSLQSGGLLGSLGSGLIGAASASNTILNTPAMSSVGQTFNKIGLGLPLVHLAADSCGYACFKGMETVGRALGGKGSVDYHFEKEWGAGKSASGGSSRSDASRYDRHDWDASRSASQFRSGGSSAQFERTTTKTRVDGSDSSITQSTSRFSSGGADARYERTTTKTRFDGPEGGYMKSTSQFSSGGASAYHERSDARFSSDSRRHGWDAKGDFSRCDSGVGGARHHRHEERAHASFAAQCGVGGGGLIGGLLTACTTLCTSLLGGLGAAQA